MTEARVYQLDDYRSRSVFEAERRAHVMERIAQLSIDISLKQAEKERLERILDD